MTFPIPDTALAYHTAVLGKTGSGKTTTAKGIIEHLVATGARVCILDPIKSDWWGLTSSADGKRAGLPFHILGGPRGHVPLHPGSGKAIGEIVANGTLPLSILDMADFPAGGLAKFFIEFAPTLLRKARGVVHLVLEEAHEFAPKERSGIGDENMLVHHAKRLATAGRSRGVRLIVLTQRTQALHNAVLGSCETMIAHRLTAPADQKPVVDWLKANVDKDNAAEIAGSLAGLKTGTAWVCSGEAGMFKLVQFPRIKTFDNSATPTGNSGEFDVRTASVDVDRLRAIVGDAAKDAEQNDPKALKAEVARLTAELRKASVPAAKSNVVPGATTNEREAAFAAGEREGRGEGYHAGWLDGEAAGFSKGIRLQKQVAAFEAKKAIEGTDAAYVPGKPPHPPKGAAAPALAPLPSAVARAPATLQRDPSVPRQPSAGRPGADQRALDALAELETMHVNKATREIVGFLSGYSNIQSPGFRDALAALKAADEIEFPAAGEVRLLPAGRQRANLPVPRTAEEIQKRIVEMLGGATGRILNHLISIHPKEVSRTYLGNVSGYSNIQSPGFRDGLAKLRTLGFIEYPSAGQVRAGDVLFLGAR